MVRKQRRPRPQSRSQILPFTFNEQNPRVGVTWSVEITRYRRTSAAMGQAFDPKTLGEVMLRGIKEGA